MGVWVEILPSMAIIGGLMWGGGKLAALWHSAAFGTVSEFGQFLFKLNA